MKIYYYILLLTIGFTAIVSFQTQAAFLRNIPYTVVQPDGDTLHCYITGDEFYRRLHDSLDYTIMKNPASGWFVYATLEKGHLTPTTHIPGRTDPVRLNLTPGATESGNTGTDSLKMYMLRKGRQQENILQYQAGKQDTLNYLIIAIRFSGVSQMTCNYNTIHRMFNDTISSHHSALTYFKNASYGQLHMLHHIFPSQTASPVLNSVQDPYTRAYYCPYNAITNTQGYKTYNEREIREKAMLTNAITQVSSQINPKLNIDANNDGYVDNVAFIVCGQVDGWSQLLWPHQWELNNGTQINGKIVKNFIFLLDNNPSYFNVGTIAHETFHTLGAPDLYHYNQTYSNLSPVGSWDLMEGTQVFPQQMGAHMKEKYGNWCKIPVITKRGTYTLYPLNSKDSYKTAYRIQSENTDESFVVEYRKHKTPFDSLVPASGLLIYRINSKFDGNADFDNINKLDEVYLYRPTIPSDSINQAQFGSGTRDSFTMNTHPRPILSDKTTTSQKIHIEHVQVQGDSLQFYYGGIYKNHLDVDFTIDTLSTPKKGQVVQLRDQSSADGNITKRKWTFTGGIPSSAQGIREVKVYYRTPGTYPVRLVVSTPLKQDSLIQNIKIP